MSTSEKPRDVSGVELLMNNHQGHKAEIDAREDNFADVYSLGKELLSMQHYASTEIKEKLRETTDKRNGMIHRLDQHLLLILKLIFISKYLDGRRGGSTCSSSWRFISSPETPPWPRPGSWPRTLT